MEAKSYDLIVLGAGPGGYVAAIRAAQLGMRVASVDENALLGGTCLRVGCIPSKSLLESTERYAQTLHGLAEHGVSAEGVRFDLAAMHRRKEKIVQTLAAGVASLFKHHDIARVRGRGRLDGAGRVVVEGPEGVQRLEARNIVLATGSRPMELPGAAPDGDRIGTSTEALAYPSPPEHLVVIGAGAIGLELGSVWQRLGTKVTVLEALDRILPGMDRELATAAQRVFQRQGFTFELGARVEKASASGSGCSVQCVGRPAFECDRVLVAVGRVAATQAIGLETAGIQPDRHGEIAVSSHFETAAKGVYGIGDCIRGPKLAHKASREGVACAEQLAGGQGHLASDIIPNVVYTHPELASVGKTEEHLQQEGRAYRKGLFPLQASGRARTLGEAEGLVKVLADAETDRVLGVHILAPHAGELIAEATAALEFGASVEDLASVCHAHPTLAESLGEAALAVSHRAIHIPNRS